MRSLALVMTLAATASMGAWSVDGMSPRSPLISEVPTSGPPAVDRRKSSSPRMTYEFMAGPSVVRAYDHCTWQAYADDYSGPGSMSYSWTVDGVSVTSGQGGSAPNYTTFILNKPVPASAFWVTVTMTHSNSSLYPPVTLNQYVTIDQNAPFCVE